MLKGCYGFYYGGDTYIRSKFSNLNELKDFLKKISNDIEENSDYNLLDIYNGEFDNIKTPLKEKVFNESGLFLGNFYDKLKDKQIEDFLISEEDYDSLYRKISDDLFNVIYSEVKNYYDRIPKKLKKNYSMKLIDNELYYSMDLKPYDSESEKLFRERLGFPVSVNSDKLKEFYLLNNGEKVAHDENGIIVLKNNSYDCLEDLIKYGSNLSEDKSSLLRYNDKKFKYKKGKDYISL